MTRRLLEATLSVQRWWRGEAQRMAQGGFVASALSPACLAPRSPVSLQKTPRSVASLACLARRLASRSTPSPSASVRFFSSSSRSSSPSSLSSLSAASLSRSLLSPLPSSSPLSPSRGSPPCSSAPSAAPSSRSSFYVSVSPLFESSCVSGWRQSSALASGLFSAWTQRPPVFAGAPSAARLTPVRCKMVKSASYRRPSRASPTGQARKRHIGVKRLSAEYVWPGVVLVKQRKVLAFNVETKRRNRHFKLYPGENVKVSKVTNLVALCHGRVKYTHDVSRDVLVVNVLPERREELLREDLWRYRTEHVRSMEENRHICFLRRKAVRMFGKELVNPPTKPPLRPFYFTKYDTWENPALPDVPQLDDDL